METKICSKCGEEKLLNDFYKNQNCKDGYRNVCKECCKKIQSEYRLENIDEINLKKKQYYQDNRENILEQKKIQWKLKPNNFEEEKLKRQMVRNQQSEKRKKEYQKKYRKKRYDEDGFFRLKYNLRRRLNDFLDGENKSTSTTNILGCDWETFKKYIESKFQDGMNWDNHCINGWHLDHYIPLKTAKNIDDLYKLNHYTNLQPLWREDNLKKSDKLPEEWLNDQHKNNKSI